MTNQDGPTMDGSEQVPEEARITGILSQVEADLALRPHEGADRLLRQRLEDAGIERTDVQIAALLHDIGYGD